MAAKSTVLGLILALGAAPLATVQVETIRFASDHSRLQSGESAVLRWEAQPNSKVYITNIGTVSRMGSWRVSPTITTIYTIVVQRPDGDITSQALEIAVEGPKGESDFPAYETFRQQISKTRQQVSTVDFLGKIHGVLQDSLGFRVQELQTVDRDMLFVTNLLERQDLRDPNETSIRARRIAYFVRVRTSQAGGDVQYWIATRLEYQRRSESTWRLENSDVLNMQQANRLQSRLSQFGK